MYCLNPFGAILHLYSWCMDVQPILNVFNYLYMRPYIMLGAMAVRRYINCTNLNWRHKCSTHSFNSFYCYLPLLQFMYGRTPNFKNFEFCCHTLCMGELGAMAARRYINCANLNWCHKCSMHSFNLFGCYLPLVQLMYGRTPNFKYFELLIYIMYRRTGSYGCTPVHQLYKSELTSQIIHAKFQFIWLIFTTCTVYVQTYIIF